MTDDIELNRRNPDEVAERAIESIDDKTVEAMAKWVIRAGLGPLFNLQNQAVDITPQEMGAIMSIKFEPENDPVQHDLVTRIDEWRDRDDD